MLHWKVLLYTSLVLDACGVLYLLLKSASYSIVLLLLALSGALSLVVCVRAPPLVLVGLITATRAVYGLRRPPRLMETLSFTLGSCIVAAWCLIIVML